MWEWDEELMTVADPFTRSMKVEGTIEIGSQNGISNLQFLFLLLPPWLFSFLVAEGRKTNCELALSQ